MPGPTEVLILATIMIWLLGLRVPELLNSLGPYVGSTDLHSHDQLHQSVRKIERLSLVGIVLLLLATIAIIFITNST